MNKKIYLLILLVLILVVSACSGGDPVPSATIDPGQMETRVAEEVAVQLTQIALDQPTTTQLPPTVPAPEIPSPTATLPPTEVSPTSEAASPTPMPPPPSNTPNAPTVTKKPLPTATPIPFACQITNQKPSDGKIFKPGANFDAVWTAKNTGTATWDSNEVDYRYDSGDKIHQNEIYDLPNTVKPGESINLVVDMQAPDDEGKYDTTWALRRGGLLICTMQIEIKVEK